MDHNRPTEPWIGTFTGKQCYPLHPDPNLIDILDIAHGLAGTFRFTGQSTRWYTVAQHSVEVSRRVPSEDARWGLLHDAAEAYLPDIARPIKGEFWVQTKLSLPSNDLFALLPFRGSEEILLRAIAKSFYLVMPIPATVHEADDRELSRERRDLWDEKQPAWSLAAEPYPEPLAPVGPEEAERLFLERFRELWPWEWWPEER